MAWELPSKPVYLDEELRDSYEMGDLPLLHRNDKNVTTAQYVLPSQKYSNRPNTNDPNFYYTNIPKRKFSYEKKNQYQSPYKSPYQTSYKPSYPATNKLQNYVSYADNLMKQFKSLTEKIPQDRPLSVQDFQEFANMLEFKLFYSISDCFFSYFDRISINMQFFLFFFQFIEKCEKFKKIRYKICAEEKKLQAFYPSSI